MFTERAVEIAQRILGVDDDQGWFPSDPEDLARAVMHDVDQASRNLISPESLGRALMTGALTFNAMPPDDYDGPMMVFAAIRLGDHAHVEVQSGRWLGTGPSHRGTNEGTCLTGIAGRVVVRWHEWERWRDLMDKTTPYRIAEVQKPTDKMLDRYVTVAPPDVGEELFR